MEIVGKSPSIISVIAMVDKIAPTTATVLIQGESGTGKELIARRLHFKSDRSSASLCHRQLWRSSRISSRIRAFWP